MAVRRLPSGLNSSRTQMRAFGSEVANHHSQRVGELLLYVQVPRLYVAVFKVGIKTAAGCSPPAAESVSKVE